MASSTPIYGQLVIGPPGSGKTTFCTKMGETLSSLGRRVIRVNLDPSNECVPYKPDIDIFDLIKTEEVMETQKLGPNGALMYCMQFLEQNVDWLSDRIRDTCLSPSAEGASSPEENIDSAGIKAASDASQPSTSSPLPSSTAPSTGYLMIDCPGQVELFTHSPHFLNIINKLRNQKESGLDLRLTAVYLLDAHYTNEPGKFVSSLVSTLSAMVHLELPHVNILSKVDLICRYGKTKFGLNYYCEVMDLNYLVEELVDDPVMKKYKKLTRLLADTIDNYSLVTFIPVAIDNNVTVLKAMRVIDRANGFHLTDLKTEEQLMRMFQDHDQSDFEWAKFAHLQQQYMEDGDEDEGDGAESTVKDDPIMMMHQDL